MYWMTDQIAQYYIFTDFLESVKITPINYDVDDLLTITKQTLGPQFMFKKKKGDSSMVVGIQVLSKFRIKNVFVWNIDIWELILLIFKKFY